jgi:hypothetical protein
MFQEQNRKERWGERYGNRARTTSIHIQQVVENRIEHNKKIFYFLTMKVTVK